MAECTATHLAAGASAAFVVELQAVVVQPDGAVAVESAAEACPVVAEKHEENLAVSLVVSVK